MPKRLDDKALELRELGLEYLLHKKTEKTAKSKIDKLKKLMQPDIKAKISTSTVTNGNHTELRIKLETKGTLLIQNQVAESVSPVDNILDVLKDKLGKGADRFILTYESLAPNALEQIRTEGLISDVDLAEMLTSKKTDRFIVKIEK